MSVKMRPSQGLEAAQALPVPTNDTPAKETHAGTPPEAQAHPEKAPPPEAKEKPSKGKAKTKVKTVEAKFTGVNSSTGTITVPVARKPARTFQHGEQVTYFTGHLTTDAAIPCIAWVQSQSLNNPEQWFVCYFIPGSSSIHWNTVSVCDPKEPKVGCIAPRSE